MSSHRLEAFSDGVIAVIITIMVLGIKVPGGTDLAALRTLAYPTAAYLLSFLYVGIYWNNHHHLLSAVERIDGRVMWANLHLLFWLSLIPLSTAWVGENVLAAIPTATYGAVLLLSAIAYMLLQSALVAHCADSLLARALGSDLKGKISPVLYVMAIAAAFYHPVVSHVLYATVACIWLVPDRRIELALLHREER